MQQQSARCLVSCWSHATRCSDNCLMLLCAGFEMLGGVELHAQIVNKVASL